MCVKFKAMVTANCFLQHRILRECNANLILLLLHYIYCHDLPLKQGLTEGTRKKMWKMLMFLFIRCGNFRKILAFKFLNTVEIYCIFD